MALKERLLLHIKKSRLSFEELSLMMGQTPYLLNKKIENDGLSVKEAYELCKLLDIENPSEVFFS